MTSNDSTHIDEAISAVISSATKYAAEVNNFSTPVSATADPVGQQFATPCSMQSIHNLTSMSLSTPRANSFTDLPENLLENSSTPPLESMRRDQEAYGLSGTSIPIKTESLGSAAPVFASLAPVSLDLHNFLPSTDSYNITINPTNNSCSPPSNLSGSTMGKPTTVPGIRHLFAATFPPTSAHCPQSVLSSNLNPNILTAMPGYLALKIDSQQQHHTDGFNLSNNSGVNSCLNLIGTGPSTLLSPAHLNLGDVRGSRWGSGGGVVNREGVPVYRRLLSSNRGSSTCNSLNLSNISSSSGDFLSLTPSSSVYVQPINPNGQLHLVKLSFSTSPSSAMCYAPMTTSWSNFQNKMPQVNTVELANNIITSMLHDQQKSKNLLDMDSTSGYSTIDTQKTVDQSDAFGSVLNSVALTSTLDLALQSKQPPLDGKRRLARATSTSASASGVAAVEKNGDGSGVNAASSSATMLAMDDGAGDANVAANGSGAENGDDIFIDTKDLCIRIAYELKAHSIPQALFAERVLCRSQGTLSDLLRNPKPWNKLKSGRETFRRMYHWLRLPLDQRMSTLDPTSNGGGAGAHSLAVETLDGLQAFDVQPTSSLHSFGQPVVQTNQQDHQRKSFAAHNQSSFIGQAIQHDQQTFAGQLPTNNQPQAFAGQAIVHANSQQTPETAARLALRDRRATAATSADDDDDEDDTASSGGGVDLDDTGAAFPAASPRQRKSIKRPRLVFTDIQKRTLQAIFKETQRPSREMQQTIAEHLGLDLSTVQNFFMNARRRSRSDLTGTDSSLSTPYPYQQVRPITPPPCTPSPPAVLPPTSSSVAVFQIVDEGGASTATTPRKRTSTKRSASVKSQPTVTQGAATWAVATPATTTSSKRPMLRGLTVVASTPPDVAEAAAAWKVIQLKLDATATSTTSDS